MFIYNIHKRLNVYIITPNYNIRYNLDTPHFITAKMAYLSSAFIVLCEISILYLIGICCGAFLTCVTIIVVDVYITKNSDRIIENNLDRSPLTDTLWVIWISVIISTTIVGFIYLIVRSVEKIYLEITSKHKKVKTTLV